VRFFAKLTNLSESIEKEVV